MVKKSILYTLMSVLLVSSFTYTGDKTEKQKSAFMAMKHMATGNGNYVPYSNEYINKITKEKSEDKLFSPGEVTSKVAIVIGVFGFLYKVGDTLLTMRDWKDEAHDAVVDVQNAAGTVKRAADWVKPGLSKVEEELERKDEMLYQAAEKEAIYKDILSKQQDIIVNMKRKPNTFTLSEIKMLADQEQDGEMKKLFNYKFNVLLIHERQCNPQGDNPPLSPKSLRILKNDDVRF